MASTDIDVKFTLNGQQHTMTVPSSTVLLTLLREHFDLRGTRASCERGVCGSCTVLIDDAPVAACSLFVYEIDGASVETVEGQLQDGELGPVQRGFVECGGFQCGFCTAGMIMLTTGLLREHPAPDRDTIREWISSNTCRCTGYEMILESVERARELAGASGEIGEPS